MLNFLKNFYKKFFPQRCLFCDEDFHAHEKNVCLNCFQKHLQFVNTETNTWVLSRKLQTVSFEKGKELFKASLFYKLIDGFEIDLTDSLLISDLDLKTQKTILEITSGNLLNDFNKIIDKKILCVFYKMGAKEKRMLEKLLRLKPKSLIIFRGI